MQGSKRRGDVVAREDLVPRTFVELADTLVDSYDPLVFLHRLAERCVEGPCPVEWWK